MSSNCPPQLQLTIQPNTTSFKRSFEQFGFDLESPVGGGITDAGGSGATNNPGNERNKRARSASSFDSETSSDLSSDSIGSRSAGSSFSSQGSSAISALSTLAEPPRLPTPRLQDVEMEEGDSFSPPGSIVLPPPQTHAQDEGDAQPSEERYRLSLERFNAFDREISVLRQSEAVSPFSRLSSSSSAASAPPLPAISQPRLSPTPPPTLPPLTVNRHRLSPSDIAFFRRTSSPLVAPWHDSAHQQVPRDLSDESRHHIRNPTPNISGSPSDEQAYAVAGHPSANQNANFRYLFREAEPFPLSMPTLSLDLSLDGTVSGEAAESSSRHSSSTSSTSPRRSLSPSRLSLSRPSSPPIVFPTEAIPAEFREMLDAALQRLRSGSPLVPGLDVEREESSMTREQASEQVDHEVESNERHGEDDGSILRTITRRLDSPPVLPPIAIVSDGSQSAPASSINADTTNSAFNRQPDTQNVRNTQTLPPSTLTLPHIPTTRTNLDTTERAWDGRAELFTNNFDELMDLGNPSALPSSSTAPRSVSEGVELNLNLGDEPSIPSPILRDLHSWMADRQPAVIAEDDRSNSSISIAAATAATETTTATATTSSSSASATSASTRTAAGRGVDHIQERLERLRERRLNEWPPDDRPPTTSSLWNTGSHGRPTASTSHGQQRGGLPVQTDRDLLSLSNIFDNPSPTLSSPSMSEEDFWAPLFAATGNATSSTNTGTLAGNAGAGPARPSYFARRGPDDHAVRSLNQDFGAGIGFGDRPSSTSSQAGPSRLSRYLSRANDGPSANTVSVSPLENEGRWRPRRHSFDVDFDSMESSDILPHLDTTSSVNRSSTATNADRDQVDSNPFMHDVLALSLPPVSNLDPRPSGQSSGTASTNTGAEDRLPVSESSQTRGSLMLDAIRRTAEIMSRTEGQTVAGIQRTDGALDEWLTNETRADTGFASNDLFGTTESRDRPRAPSLSTLSNWDGRSAPQADSRSQSQAQTSYSQSMSSTATASSASRRLPMMFGSGDRWPADNRGGETQLRNRLRSYHAQTRPGSSSSLVTENASEARRRVDQEQLNTRASAGQRRLDQDGDMRRLMDADEESIAREIEGQFGDTTWADPRRSGHPHNGPSGTFMDSSGVGAPTSQHSAASPSAATANTSGEHMDVFDSGIGFAPLPSLGAFVHTMSLDTIPSTGHNAGGATARHSGPDFPRVSGPSWMNHNSQHDESPYPNPPSPSIYRHPPTFSSESTSVTSFSSFDDQQQSGNSQVRFNAGTISTQRHRNDAPSLPHPDLGTSFDAQRHSSGISTQWRPTEDDSIDISMEESPRPSMTHAAATINVENHGATSTVPVGPTHVRTPFVPRSRRTEDRNREEEFMRLRERLRERVQTPQQLSYERSPTRNNATAISAATTNLTTSTPSSLSTSSGAPRPARRPMQGQFPVGNALPSPTLPPYIDPETFTGPFRSTMQQFAMEREGRSGVGSEEQQTWSRPTTYRPRSPPSIPPLPFDARDSTISLGPTQQGDSELETATASGFAARQARLQREGERIRIHEANLINLQASQRQIAQTRPDPPIRSRAAAVHDFESRLPGFSSVSTSNEGTNVGDGPASRNSTATRRTAISDGTIDSVYRYITQRAHMEAEAEENPERPLYNRLRSLVSGTAPSGNEPQPMRLQHLARSQHLTLMQQRQMHQDMERRRAAEELTERPGHPNARPYAVRTGPGPSFYGRSGPEAPESNTSGAAASSADDDDDMTGGEAAQRTRNRRRFTRNPSVTAYALGRAHAHMGMMGGLRRGRPIGDYIRDEEFDGSYESLLSLDEALDFKPRGTPTEILDKMEKGVYRDWVTEGSDTRCPICLDDYEPADPVLKLNNCSHWLHQECLSQWLQSANTCPVCRGSVGRATSSTGTNPASRAPRPAGISPFTAFTARRRESPPGTFATRAAQAITQHRARAAQAVTQRQLLLPLQRTRLHQSTTAPLPSPGAASPGATPTSAGSSTAAEFPAPAPGLRGPRGRSSSQGSPDASSGFGAPWRSLR